jgi:hypothetical protein
MKRKLSPEQINNLKNLGITKVNTEGEALKILRKNKLTKRFQLTDFHAPSFNVVFKSLKKN